MIDATELVKSTRQELGLDRGGLAIRSGVCEEDIAKIENGELSPTVEQLNNLMLVMGRDIQPAPRPLRDALEMGINVTPDTPGERLAMACGWSKSVSQWRRAALKSRSRDSGTP